MSQSTGIERITLSRASPSMIEDPGLLRVSMHAKRPLGMRIFLSLWLLVWLGAETAIVMPLVWRDWPWRVELPPSVPAAWGLVGAVTLGGLFVAIRLAWRLFGEEVLFISPQILRVRRSIGPFRWTKEFPFGQLRDLQLSQERDSQGLPSWGRMFVGRSGNAILFTYKGRTYQVARELDTAEAAYLLNVIQLWTQNE